MPFSVDAFDTKNEEEEDMTGNLWTRKTHLRAQLMIYIS